MVIKSKSNDWIECLSIFEGTDEFTSHSALAAALALRRLAAA